MIMLEWNALRVGDRVVVHDERDAAMPLIDGVVTMIQTVTRGSNDLAIRVSDSESSSTVLRPRRLAVHLERLDADEVCWRCAITHAAGNGAHQVSR